MRRILGAVLITAPEPSNPPVRRVSLYQTPTFCIDFQGSAGASAAPFWSNSTEILSGERMKAIFPSRGGRLMTSLLTSDAEDRVEEWLGVPMFFGGSKPESGERLLRETGFELQLSEVREEGVDDGYGPVTSYWVIARKPDD